MSYHCSISAISAPTARNKSRRMYIPQYIEVPRPYNSIMEMFNAIGFHQGEWILLDKCHVGTLTSLGLSGILLARKKQHRLFLADSGKVYVVHQTNFVRTIDAPDKE